MARGVETWIHISIGTLTVETGIETDYYAPDVIRDAWTQAVRGIKETIEAAAALGLVQFEPEVIDAEDIELVTEADTDDDSDT